MDGSRDTCQSIQNLPKADPVSLWIAWPIFSRPFLYVFIIYHYGYIRFTKTKGTFPVSEKVLSEQLKEMISDGLIERIQYDEVPLRVEYVLTDVGKKTMPAVDMLYI